MQFFLSEFSALEKQKARREAVGCLVALAGVSLVVFELLYTAMLSIVFTVPLLTLAIAVFGLCCLVLVKAVRPRPLSLDASDSGVRLSFRSGRTTFFDWRTFASRGELLEITNPVGEPYPVARFNLTVRMTASLSFGITEEVDSTLRGLARAAGLSETRRDKRKLAPSGWKTYGTITRFGNVPT